MIPLDSLGDIYYTISSIPLICFTTKMKFILLVRTAFYENILNGKNHSIPQ